MKRMKARYPGECKGCGDPVEVGQDILWSRASGALHTGCRNMFGGDEPEHTISDDDYPEYAEAVRERARMDAEYARGYYETRDAQLAGPPGSDAREAAYREMEERWAREGFDG